MVQSTKAWPVAGVATHALAAPDHAVAQPALALSLSGAAHPAYHDFDAPNTIPDTLVKATCIASCGTAQKASLPTSVASHTTIGDALTACTQGRPSPHPQPLVKSTQAQPLASAAPHAGHAPAAPHQLAFGTAAMPASSRGYPSNATISLNHSNPNVDDSAPTSPSTGPKHQFEPTLGRASFYAAPGASTMLLLEEALALAEDSLDPLLLYHLPVQRMLTQMQLQA